MMYFADSNEDVHIAVQENPDVEELKKMWIAVFNALPPDDVERLKAETDQTFEEWFSVEEMAHYKDGKLIEIRTNKNILVGAAYVGKQNPISWIDGKKAELFILGILAEFRGKGLGKELIKKAEEVAKSMGAEKLLVNTHVAMESDKIFYEKVGFTQIGILEHYYGNGSAIFFFKEL